MGGTRGREQGRSVLAEDEEDFDLRALARLGTWGLCAVLAVGAAVAAARTDVGTHRLANLFRIGPVAATPDARVSARANNAQNDIRQLEETVRALATDRDRLATRVGTVERNLADLTGSIPRQREPAAETPIGVILPASVGAAKVGAPETVPAAPLALTPTTSSRRSNSTSGASAPAASSEAAPAGKASLASTTLDRISGGLAAAGTASDQGLVTRTEFGVDLGGSATLAGLRSLWLSVKGNRAALFAKLYPVVSVRDGRRPGSVDLRLVAGPLRNAESAARLCAVLGASGVFCRQTVFEGQRL